MATTEELSPRTKAHLDEEALIKEARVLAKRRRLRRGFFSVAIVAVVGIIFVGSHLFSPAAMSTATKNESASAAPSCLSARVKLIGVMAIPGGLGHAGLIVRASASSSLTCVLSGYPTATAELSNHLKAGASDVRNAYLGGVAAKLSAPLPRPLITSSSRVVSFTIQWADGNGPTCPSVTNIQVAFPGLNDVQTARSIFEPGVGKTRFMGIYCRQLIVTPLVNGSSGSAD